MKFEELKINPKLLKKTKELGFEKLTDIQEKCIPLIYKGKDVVGQAETGSGKTLAFGLPIMEKIALNEGSLQVLVLTPTRELCVQVTGVFRDFGNLLGIKSTSVYGGVGIEPQIRNIRTSNVVVGTPGRILDHIGRGTINLRNIRFLVIDEADKMFEMGFIDDVEKIIRHVPGQRQTVMLSATISDDVYGIMKKHLKNAIIVKTQEYIDTSKLRQVYYDIYEQNEKFSLLVHLLKNDTPGLAIVFCATRRESDIVDRNLKRQNINVMAIHGGMTQKKRQESLDALRHQDISVLVATDVAARGLDIPNVTHIYNYDVPSTPEEYIHRVGRTARAGKKGSAVTLLTWPDHDNFRRVQSDKELKEAIQQAEMPEFEKVPFQRRSPMDQSYSVRRGGRGRNGRMRRPPYSRDRRR